MRNTADAMVILLTVMAAIVGGLVIGVTVARLDTNEVVLNQFCAPLCEGNDKPAVSFENKKFVCSCSHIVVKTVP